jgi:threonine dehydrogenase-like Zn-dependent dehydrogenase
MTSQDEMRALVFTGPGVVELLDVARPQPANDEVVVDVRAAGICGSELHGFRSVGFRRPPLVMGHEFAGVTPDGRRVVVNPLLSCGRCDLCGRDAPQLCRDRELLGVHRAGGFAEAAAVPQSTLYVIPDDMSWETAALVEPLANAVHAWKRAPAKPGQRVAVIGAGPIGLVTLLVARQQGLDVTVVDRAPARLDLADRLGAARCSTSLEGEFDVIVDAVGLAVTRSTAVELLVPGGVTIWLGLAEPPSGFDGSGLVRGEKRVVGSFGYTPREFTKALDLAPQLDLDWATEVPLEDSQRAFMELAEGASEPVKAVIRR